MLSVITHYEKFTVRYLIPFVILSRRLSVRRRSIIHIGFTQHKSILVLGIFNHYFPVRREFDRLTRQPDYALDKILGLVLRSTKDDHVTTLGIMKPIRHQISQYILMGIKSRLHRLANHLMGFDQQKVNHQKNGDRNQDRRDYIQKKVG